MVHVRHTKASTFKVNAITAYCRCSKYSHQANPRDFAGDAVLDPCTYGLTVFADF
jgi:hypothetical protein